MKQLCFCVVVLLLQTRCSAGDLNGEAASSDAVSNPSAQTGAGQLSGGTATVAAVCPLGQQPNGVVGGPSICCSGNYALCDDFEAQAPGASPNALLWQVESLTSSYGLLASEPPATSNLDNNALIEISSAISARGKQSLHILAHNSSALPNNGWHHNMLVNRSIFPAPNNTFWGRAFLYYVSDSNSALPGGHCTYADAAGTVTGSSSFYTWWRISTFGNFAINCEHGDQGASSPVRLPVNRWACLEWQYKGDASNEVHLYLDGNQLAMTTASSETADNPQGLAPVYDAFRLGWEVYGYQYNPAPAYFEMYYDEVALDYNRIGCAN